MRKFRGRLPRKGPLPFRYVLLLTIVFFILSTSAGLYMVNKGLKPTLTSYAKTQTRKIATLVISNAINKKIASEMNIEEIIEPIPNEQGMYKLNAEIVNRVKTETVHLVQKNLKEVEKGNLTELEQLTDVEFKKDDKGEDGIVYYVPLGQATENALLGNLGPKIPIRFTAIGDVSTNVETKIEKFEINNAFLQVYVKLTVNVQIIIPFATEVTKITENVPVGMFILKGDVPQFYNGGGESGASIDVPIR